MNHEIKNAGLVILHPFLPTLFSRLDYLVDHAFADAEKQKRSAQLLEYIIYGKPPAKENNLALNKILCGIEQKEIVADNFILTEAETSLAEECCRVLINHWGKIGNTSIEGLRESFLQRNGKIIKTKDGFTLEVEQKSFDMLLDYLPWNFSTIKTEWMKQTLFVKWK